MPRVGEKKQHPGFMNLTEKNFAFSTESFLYLDFFPKPEQQNIEIKPL